MFLVCKCDSVVRQAPNVHFAAIGIEAKIQKESTVIYRLKRVSLVLYVEGRSDARVFRNISHK